MGLYTMGLLCMGERRGGNVTPITSAHEPLVEVWCGVTRQEWWIIIIQMVPQLLGDADTASSGTHVHPE